MCAWSVIEEATDTKKDACARGAHMLPEESQRYYLNTIEVLGPRLIWVVDEQRSRFR